MAKKKSKTKKSKQSTTPAIPLVNDQVEDAIAAALCKAPPVLMKVCRLCEMKDGPFLNIFDADKVTAKKIEDLMPFGIAENDNLPHKICFRCSAKVEELHEFIQKCIKTQENLRSAMGNQGPPTMKSRSRDRWEEGLHKTNFSNDDICHVLIKRAMEGIPLNAPLDDIAEETPPAITRKSKVEPSVVPNVINSSDSSSDDDEDANISLNEVKLSKSKTDEEPPVTRASRSTKSADLNEGFETNISNAKVVQKKSLNIPATVKVKPPETQKQKTVEVVENKKESLLEKPKEILPPPPPEPKQVTTPFNIMDHVSTIKVHGVGTLFQCKLCIRNFLKKDIVMNHGCAKNNAPPKETTSANACLPEPPKPPTVKYIKMNNDIKRPLSALVNKTIEKSIAPIDPSPKPAEPEVKPKPKPKVGPASRVKPRPETPKEIPKEPTPSKSVPEVQSLPASGPPSISFPIVPSLNSRYKLVPGPNNSFQLVEETVVPVEKPVEEKPIEEIVNDRKTNKRKTNEPSTKSLSLKKHKGAITEKSSSPEVIDLENNESQKPEPYPVGLFQPVPHHSSIYPPSNPPVPFTTPAMKKQSYTIVQTGNPSKLLISTKPQPVAEEQLKKKSKKKTEVKEKEPYKVTVEDTAPQKDPGFFTFVSLDPLLQPSYVLSTDNIIQESQITTSTPGSKPATEKDNDKYPCNMCGETFSREKKLLSHIQSHYNQMDEEDEKRTGKPGPKRRTRKS